jgi:hypothetical protein
VVAPACELRHNPFEVVSAGHSKKSVPRSSTWSTYSSRVGTEGIEVRNLRFRSSGGVKEYAVLTRRAGWSTTWSEHRPATKSAAREASARSTVPRDRGC